VNIEKIRQILQPIDDLWNRVLVADAAYLFEPELPIRNWHGYGWREKKNDLVVSPFAEDPKDLVAIAAQIKKLAPDVEVDGLVVPHFRVIGSGEPEELPDLAPFQPGNVIKRDCASALNGTIGAFLTADRDGSTWLVSNRHVMAGCLGSPLLGAGRVELGTDVRPVPVLGTGNLVDASVVKIDDPLQVNPQFEKVGPVKQLNPQTLPNLIEGTPVSKLGFSSKFKTGTLVLNCPKVKVRDLDGIAKEFVDQFAIVSKEAFAQEGDSGSLIVGEEQPLGLLFAMSDDVIDIPEDQSLKPPFYLANRWDNVIQALQSPRIVGLPLKLLLSKEAAATL
jgi:hypothetical protein